MGTDVYQLAIPKILS